MRFHQEPVEPGISLATDGIRVVVEAVVSQNFRPRRVRSPNLRTPVHDAIGLVEIYRLFHVGWNYGIVLADFGHAIHLDSEQDGDAVPFEVLRARDTVSDAPQLCPKMMMRACCFSSADSLPSRFASRSPQNFLVGLGAMTVREALYIHPIGVFVAQVFDHLHRAVHAVIVPDEAADKADDDGGRCGACLG